MTELPTTMRAIEQDAPGTPLKLAERPVPSPGAGEVLVRVAASPINPSDLAMLEGGYGIRFDYPMVPGLEGSGTVVAAGAGMAARFMEGRKVACVASTQGLWAEYVCVPASQCIPLPADVPLGAGAMAMVNPLTAYAFARIARAEGHWSLVSTAAGGALGAMIRRACKARGVKVINIVRTEEQRQWLEAERAIVLDMTAEGFDAALAEACKRYRCRLALDAVGGDMTFRLVEALPANSTVLLYGGLAGKAAAVHPGTMIFRQSTVRGFWLTRWLGKRSLPEMLWITRQVSKGLSDTFATERVAAILPLDEATDAPARYASQMSAGKVLIAPGEADLGLEPTG